MPHLPENRADIVRWYKTIGDVWCPALGMHVRFNKHGIHHILYKPAHLPELEERLVALRFAPEIVAHSDTQFHCEERTEARYWSATRLIVDTRIKIVLRRLGDGVIHFYSVMVRKTAP